MRQNQSQVSELSDEEEVSFSSPKMILDFLKSVFEQLSQSDEQEKCESEEDKRASTFQDKVFMRFALMHFYMHQLATLHRTTVETHQHCGNQVEKLMIGF